MIDKTQNREDVMAMRKLFWDKVNGKITHTQVMEGLKKINNRQTTFLEPQQKQLENE